MRHFPFHTNRDTTSRWDHLLSRSVFRFAADGLRQRSVGAQDCLKYQLDVVESAVNGSRCLDKVCKRQDRVGAVRPAKDSEYKMRWRGSRRPSSGWGIRLSSRQPLARNQLSEKAQKSDQTPGVLLAVSKQVVLELFSRTRLQPVHTEEQPLQLKTRRF